jgi:predicted nucleic acid-binding Zn ribbon protein
MMAGTTRSWEKERPVRPKRKVEQLSNTIERLLVSRGMASKLKEYRVFGRWERAVGEVIARHTHPAAIRGKKLTVVVDSSAWMQQLSLLKPEIIGKVNEALGEAAVESIILKLGDVAARPRVPERAPERRTIQLGPEERTKIDGFVQAISDPEAREALRHLIEKDYLRRKVPRPD